jgi:hypothetical protein
LTHKDTKGKLVECAPNTKVNWNGGVCAGAGDVWVGDGGSEE